MDVQMDETLAANQADHLAVLKCYNDKLIQLFELHTMVFNTRQTLIIANSKESFVTNWLLQHRCNKAIIIKPAVFHVFSFAEKC